MVKFRCSLYRDCTVLRFRNKPDLSVFRERARPITNGMDTVDNSTDAHLWSHVSPPALKTWYVTGSAICFVLSGHNARKVNTLTLLRCECPKKNTSVRENCPHTPKNTTRLSNYVFRISTCFVRRKLPANGAALKLTSRDTIQKLFIYRTRWWMPVICIKIHSVRNWDGSVQNFRLNSV